MIFGNKMKSELKVADVVLSRREKIRAAIGAEVSKLGEAVRRRVEAERAHREAEANHLIGEGPAPDAALQRISKHAADIEGIGRALASLRAAAAKMAPEIIGSFDAVGRELPAHNAAMEADFAREWQKGIAAFSALLAKRAAVESIAGRRLELEEPKPSAVADDIAEARRPKETRETLRTAMEAISAPVPSRYPDPNNMFQPFDPRRVYVMAKQFQDPTGPEMLPGELVVEQSFEPGYLDFLVALGFAVERPEEEREGAREAVHNAMLRIRAEDQNALQAEQIERAKSLPSVPRHPGQPGLLPDSTGDGDAAWREHQARGPRRDINTLTYPA